jgi:hypothetical protein
MSGSDFSMVCAMQGKAIAQKANAKVKTRMGTVQQAGRTIIPDLTQKFRDIEKKFRWQISWAGFHQVK